jgi:L-alanine-DL-glutamate epimerase-like enolase superfamily enzyme
VASNFDGPLGIAAGLHAAAGLRASGPVAYCGLATLSAFEDFDGVLAAVDGAVAVPDGPGLLGGVEGVD